MFLRDFGRSQLMHLKLFGLPMSEHENNKPVRDWQDLLHISNKRDADVEQVMEIPGLKNFDHPLVTALRVILPVLQNAHRENRFEMVRQRFQPQIFGLCLRKIESS